MKHALFVSFHYAPDATSSGVLRTLKYTKYLADLGWRCTVLCPEATAYDWIDDDIIKQVPPIVKIVRTGYWNTRSALSVRGRYPALLALPDVWIGWLPWALAAGKRIADLDPVDVIYSTSPPATAHVVAWRLAKRLQKPWVADFRDPWIEEPPEPGAPAGFLFRTIDKWLERRVVESSSHVVTTTDNLREVMRARYRGQPRGKFSTIANGYDEADFSFLPTTKPRADPCLRIVHAGGINAQFRDPRPLFVALRRLGDSGRIDLRAIKVRFIGGGAYADGPEVRNNVRDLGLQSVAEFLPRLPYARALEELTAADVLLLLQASEDTRGLVPAKLYEYLRVQKPVLALIQPGESSRVLQATGGGVAIDPRDEARLMEELAQVYARWRNGSLGQQTTNLAILRTFDRRHLTRELAGIFERLVGGVGALREVR